MLYTTLVRGVPDLVMMMLVFYGGQLLLNEALDRVMDGRDWRNHRILERLHELGLELNRAFVCTRALRHL